MSNQKNELDFQDNVTKKEFKVLYDALKYAMIPFSTGHNAVYGPGDAMGITANTAAQIIAILMWMFRVGCPLKSFPAMQGLNQTGK